MRFTVATVLFLCLTMQARSQDHSPYVGQESRNLKSLTDAQIAGFLQGNGMGFAKPAELNHYPGPKHVLELQDKLGLSSEQLQAAKRAFKQMKARAEDLGRKYVDLETRLEKLFAMAEADSSTIARLTQEIAVVNGQIRLAHLQAHVAMKKILTPHQVTIYDRLRGYSGNSEHHIFKH